ncbi:MAG: UvrD-helicase domain-containing protein [Proteobacteria bacterium]|nr:UvrD-helicase domain-containing protein [Pseudomonadota bacterium]
MGTWLLPPRDLTPDQTRAVEMKPDQNRVVFGIAGSGKTQVLIHRACYLAKTYKVPSEKYRVFVFTNVIKQYIKSGIQFLGLPDETVSTFDHWCRLNYEKEISKSLPWAGKTIDFEKIRLSVLDRLKTRPALQKNLDFILVDEGQDLSPQAFEIIALAARHVTVFADRMQQIFEDGAGEEQILARMGIRKENATLLGAYRNSPYVAQLAAYFIPDAVRRGQYLSQIGTQQLTKERPLCFIARNHDEEMDRMAEVIRQRQLRNERVGIIVPKNKQVHGFATAMQERGIDIEKAVPPKRPGMPADFDFGNNLPKIATYHSAKGLTFDSVLLPKITASAFDNINDSGLRQRMLFVGVARATQWVYLSTTKGMELDEFSLLKDAATKNHLTIQDGIASPVKTKMAQPDDDYDAPF